MRKIECTTAGLLIHGFSTHGSDASRISATAKENPALLRRLNENFSHIGAEVVWAVRHEMARTVEDVLARRLRVLFHNASVAMEMAPLVARLMAAELNKDYARQESQVLDFSRLASQYLGTAKRPLESVNKKETIR